MNSYPGGVFRQDNATEGIQSQVVPGIDLLIWFYNSM